MEEDLIAKLSETTALTTLVQNKINWLTIPQGETVPAIVLSKLSSVGQINHDGPDNLYETGIQFDCWAKTFAESSAIRDALKATLLGAKFTQGDTEFQGCFLDSERDSFEDYGEQSPERYYRCSIDMRVWHNA